MEAEAKCKYNKAVDTEELFWKEKARVKWYSDGDRNTNYFHMVDKIGHASKQITSLKHGDQLLTPPNEIENL